MNIVVNVCGYRYTRPFIQAFTQLVSSGKVHSFILVDSALLPMGRNMGVQATYDKVPNFTHILFIDDDMTNFTADHLQTLIDADKDIISGVFTSRKLPYKVSAFNIEPPELEEYLKQDMLLQIGGTGMAFTLVKRAVFESVKETVPGESLGIWFTCDRYSRATLGEEVADYLENVYRTIPEDKLSFEQLKEIVTNAVLIGQTAHIGTTFIGEDISFCQRARLFGHDTFIHTGVKVGHLIEEPVTVDNRKDLCKAFGQ